MGQNVCLNLVKKDQLRTITLKIEGFTQNDRYGNQPQPFEVVFNSITDCNANSSFSFTKQDYTSILCKFLFCYV